MGNVVSSIPGLYTGSSGYGYPYDSTTSNGKFISGIVDYAPLTSNVSIAVIPTANLTVLCGIGGLSCVGNSTDFAIPVNKSISASATINYTFSNWSVTSGNCTITNANSNATFAEFLNTTSSCIVTANFNYTPIIILTANLTVINGTGNATDFQIPANKSINASIIANYTFSNWTVVSGNCTITNYLSNSTFAEFLNTTSSCTVQANFNYTYVPSTETGNLTINAGIGGVAFGNATNFTVPSNKSINASANTNYTFLNWSSIGNCTVYNITNNVTTVEVRSGTCLVNASFNYTPPAPTYYGNLSVIAGTGGTVSGSDNNFIVPANKSINATANTNYTFNQWLSTGNCSVDSIYSSSTNVYVLSGLCTVGASFNYTPITPPTPGGGGGGYTPFISPTLENVTTTASMQGMSITGFGQSAFGAITFGHIISLILLILFFISLKYKTGWQRLLKYALFLLLILVALS